MERDQSMFCNRKKKIVALIKRILLHQVLAIKNLKRGLIVITTMEKLKILMALGGGGLHRMVVYGCRVIIWMEELAGQFNIPTETISTYILTGILASI